ncbi:MAG TPA: hypothetical protein ENK11_00365 [Phycisphaerales bacterium]|nr:hypothetical protein [Phycisphaerales bacterium]
MNKKSGKACKCIKPSSPDDACDADTADPGEVAKVKAKQKETQTGKYGSTKAKPFKETPGEEGEEKEKSWIEIELRDQEGEPIAGEQYEILLPDGTIAKGSLDGNGFARVAGFEPGQCKVTFPALDKDATEPDS